MRPIYSHVMVGANDVARQIAFYDAVLAAIGLVRSWTGDENDLPGATWTREGARWPQFCVQAPYDRRPASVGNGVQVSFQAPSRAAVDEAHRLALAHGGSDEGAPGLRPQYSADYYGAYVRDPEGNKIHFVHVDAFDENLSP